MDALPAPKNFSIWQSAGAAVPTERRTGHHLYTSNTLNNAQQWTCVRWSTQFFCSLFILVNVGERQQYLCGWEWMNERIPYSRTHTHRDSSSDIWEDSRVLCIVYLVIWRSGWHGIYRTGPKRAKIFLQYFRLLAIHIVRLCRSLQFWLHQQRSKIPLYTNALWMFADHRLVCLDVPKYAQSTPTSTQHHSTHVWPTSIPNWPGFRCAEIHVLWLCNQSWFWLHGFSSILPMPESHNDRLINHLGDILAHTVLLRCVPLWLPLLVEGGSGCDVATRHAVITAEPSIKSIVR